MPIKVQNSTRGGLPVENHKRRPPAKETGSEGKCMTGSASAESRDDDGVELERHHMETGVTLESLTADAAAEAA